MVEGAPRGDEQISVRVVAEAKQAKQEPRQQQQQQQQQHQQQYDKKYSSMMTAIIQSRYKSHRSKHGGAASGINNLPRGVVNPFSIRYNLWLALTILAAAFTGWFEIYAMAFSDHPGLYPPTDASSIIAYIMFAIFGADMLLHFRVAILQGDRLISHPRDIARAYGQRRFIVDLVSVLPFDYIALALMGKQAAPQSDAAGVSALKLLRLVRMYRLRYFFDFLAVHPQVPYTLLVIIRNYTIVFYVVHFAGCMLYYIARLQGFSAMTWVAQRSDRFAGNSSFERYLYSIYWAMTTLTSIGYGDLHPYSIPEVAFVIFYHAVIISILAFLAASITNLVIKSDTFTGRYQEQLKNVLQFSRTHDLPGDMAESLADHLRLHMANEAASDSAILAIYPSAVRRKVLRHLYRHDFEGCYLFKGCPGPFLDKLITQAHVEMYMPEVEIITQGEGVDHLYILVSGTAELAGSRPSEAAAAFDVHPAAILEGVPAAAVAAPAQPGGVLLMDGSMFGELSFFLQDDSVDTVRTLTVCRVLAVSRKTYEAIKALYPIAARAVLQNLYNAAAEAIRRQEEIGIPLSARSTVWAAVTPRGLQRQNSWAAAHNGDPAHPSPLEPSAADEAQQLVPQRSLDPQDTWRKQRRQLKQQLQQVGELLQQHDQLLQRDAAVLSSAATAAAVAAAAPAFAPASAAAPSGPPHADPTAAASVAAAAAPFKPVAGDAVVPTAPP